MKKSIKAGVFKAECLRIMDKVKKSKSSVIMTKRNIPIVKVVPLDTEDQQLFGKMKGSGRAVGDIVASTGEQWDANS